MLMDEDSQRLWSLLAELSGQLTSNREQCEALKRQAEELKKQAIHTGTGYALRRFNVDLSQEQFDSELERMNAQLVVENQTLQHENRQLSVLLKDYETTLEQVMTKFRSHAHSTQTHELDLVRYYEQAILTALDQPVSSDPYSPSNPNYNSLADPHVLQSLQHLSSLVHRALRSLQGEEDPDAVDGRSPSSSSSSDAGDAPLPFAARRNNSTIPPVASSSTLEEPPQASSSSEMVHSPSPPPPARLPSYMPRTRDVSSGGYIGPRGTALTDAALQHDIELQQLRLENSQLRELLGIAKHVGEATEDASAYPSDGHDGPEPGALDTRSRSGSGGDKKTKEQQSALARTGAGVVVPEELIKGAEIDAMEGKAASEGVLSDSQI